jgi:hypothetical protein
VQFFELTMRPARIVPQGHLPPPAEARRADHVWEKATLRTVAAKL